MTATLPALAENAITVLFERTINETRIFWTQRDDGTFCCRDWEWCCPEIPAVLSGLDAVVVLTRGPSTVRLAKPDVLVVALEGSRVWGRNKVLRQAPRGVLAITWDDRARVAI